VDDGSDVGLIYAHAEGDRCNDDVEAAVEEAGLDAAADLGGKASVIRRRGDDGLERYGVLFGLFAGGGVDDGGSAGGVCEELADEVWPLRWGGFDDLDGDADDSIVN
jgi:hypothetical protein